MLTMKIIWNIYTRSNDMICTVYFTLLLSCQQFHVIWAFITVFASGYDPIEIFLNFFHCRWPFRDTWWMVSLQRKPVYDLLIGYDPVKSDTDSLIQQLLFYLLDRIMSDKTLTCSYFFMNKQLCIIKVKIRYQPYIQ